MNEPSILTIVPPLAAIVIAVWRKNALLALAFGLWLTYFLSSSYSPLQSVKLTGMGLYDTLSSTGNFRIIVYSLLIGSLLTLMKKSGGITAFVDRITSRNWVNSRKKAALVPATIGSIIFTDTNLSLFSAGMASQKLFERFKMNRATLAYLIDSTCAPISVLILINGWGAYILGLLEAQNIENGVGLLIDTIGYNFYALVAVGLAYFTAISGKVFGPMKNSTLYSEPREGQVEQAKDAADSDKSTKTRYFFVPLVLMIIETFFLLWWTGDGDIRQGSGSFSVLWSVVSSLVLLVAFILIDKVMSVGQILAGAWEGLKSMSPVVAILILSFAFGDAVKAFGTGVYVSGVLSADLPMLLIAPVIFLTAAGMAFATGSSWSTFAILIPIAIPTAAATGLPPAFLVGAVLGGGIFGDHASPISDTTVVASLASDCDHIEHVKTQLPYALFGGVVAIGLYVVFAVMF
ncbi:MAG: sodium:proton antiporter [Algicola sp.]|nr:sodium:proton antiporter [Algicola sp.]